MKINATGIQQILQHTNKTTMLPPFIIDLPTDTVMWQLW